mgnify:CR=1 FL=1
MKYLVLSDIHGSLHYAKKIEEIINKESPEKIVLLGDLYYHGPRNPLTEEYAPKEVADILNSYKDKILAVRGNCDAEVDQMISEFKLEENLRLKIGEKKFLFTHAGSISLPKNGTENSYLIIDETKISLKNVNGNLIDEIGF